VDNYAASSSARSSPDRVDALVWALTKLSGPQHFVKDYAAADLIQKKTKREPLPTPALFKSEDRQ
jgi:hypothetical protein